jgi:hypothetical protein
MNVKQLRTASIGRCNEKGISSSWVQFSKKAKLMRFLDGTYIRPDDPLFVKGSDDDGWKSDDDGNPTDGDGKPTSGDSDSASKENDTKTDGTLGSLETTIVNAVTKKIVDDGAIVKEIVKEVKDEVIKPVTITINDRVVFDPSKDGLLHYQFADVFDKLNTYDKVFLHGERGTGKSTIGEELFRLMAEKHNWEEDDKYRYTYVVGSAGVSEAQLLGKSTFDGRYIEGQYVKAFSEGGIIVADEFNGFDPNMCLIHNSMLDGQGLMFTPNDPESPHRLRHDDFYFVAIDNTNGYGNDFSYVGRNQQDLATLDRFTSATISIGYDKTIEEHIVGSYGEVALALWDLRRRIKKERLNRNISTRAFYTSAKMIHQAVNGRLMASKSVSPISNGRFDEIGVSKSSVYYGILDICADFTDEEKQKIDLGSFKTKYDTIYGADDNPSDDDTNEVLSSIENASKGMSINTGGVVSIATATEGVE